MKQSLFANCYSTIHGLNLIKTNKQQTTYTHTFWSFAGNIGRKFKTSTLFYLVTLREEDHKQRLGCLSAYRSICQVSKIKDVFGLLALG